MVEILPKLLWIGNAFDVRESQPLFERGIAAIVDLAYEERQAQLPRQLIYCRFPLVDGQGNDRNVLIQARQTTVELVIKKIPTLVACSAGMSRSPIITAFALSQIDNREPEATLGLISEKKSLEVNPMLWDEMKHLD